MSLEWILSLVGAVLGSSALSTMVTAYYNKNRAKADIADVIIKNILNWATKLSSRIDTLEEEIEERDKKIDTLIKELHEKDLLIKELQVKVEKLERNGHDRIS